MNAFFEEEEAIEPPDDDIIEALRANLDALNGLTKDRTLLANVVVITTTAAETFQSVQA